MPGGAPRWSWQFVHCQDDQCRSVTTQTPSPEQQDKNAEPRVAKRPTLADPSWIDHRWQRVRKCPENFESTADFWRSSATQTTGLAAFTTKLKSLGIDPIQAHAGAEYMDS